MSSKIPSDSVILEQIKCLIPQTNIDNMTIKQFIKKLSTTMGINLTEKKDFIKDSLTKILNEDQDENDSFDEKEEVEQENDDEMDKAAPKAKRGWAAMKKELSPQLAEFLGKREETRPQVVKLIWDYIKKNNLQNPDNRKEIKFDERLRDIFKVDTCSIVHLSKYISSHVHPFKPVDLEKSQKTLQRKQQEKTSKKRKGFHEKTKGEEDRSGKKKRKQKQYLLSDDLRKVVGKDILSRPEVIQRLWVYIREHNLQNPEDKRQIKCDELLKKVMAGNDTVTIFSLNKYFGAHLMEPQDDQQET